MGSSWPSQWRTRNSKHSATPAQSCRLDNSFMVGEDLQFVCVYKCELMLQKWMEQSKRVNFIFSEGPFASY